MRFDDDIDERPMFADTSALEGERDRGPMPAYTVEMAKEPAAPLSAEELYQRGRTLFEHNPAYTGVFLDTVAACDGRVCTLGELEARIEALPGYAKHKNPPYFPVSWLRDVGALEELFLDAAGTVYEAKDLEALDEDAFDDLVAQYAYRTTDNGRKLAEEFNPARRLAALLEKEPARKEAYLDLLGFLREKRSFSEIDRFLCECHAHNLTAQDGTTVQPSMFIDKLGTTGAVDFDGGWMMTKEGKEMLDAVKKA